MQYSMMNLVFPVVVAALYFNCTALYFNTLAFRHVDHVLWSNSVLSYGNQ